MTTEELEIAIPCEREILIPDDERTVVVQDDARTLLIPGGSAQ